MNDAFRGDDAALVASIRALLDLDAAGVLVPHGIGGHARTLLASAAARLAQTPEESSAVATQPEGQEADAERYRLLRRGQHWSVIDGVGDDLRGDALDAAIDSVRAVQAGGGK